MYILYYIYIYIYIYTILYLYTLYFPYFFYFIPMIIIYQVCYSHVITPPINIILYMQLVSIKRENLIRYNDEQNT